MSIVYTQRGALDVREIMLSERAAPGHIDSLCVYAEMRHARNSAGH
jgi:hypothetical protein